MGGVGLRWSLQGKKAETDWVRETVGGAADGVQGAKWNALRRVPQERLGQAGGLAAVFSSKTKEQMKLPAQGCW